MSNEVMTLGSEVISSLVLNGDLKRLSPQQKVEYHNYRCQQAGLDPSAKPFDLLVLNGKEMLYANAGCSQQLCAIHKLSHQVTSRELVDDIYCVFVKVNGPDGRSTENMGAVSVAGLKGEPKANAMLKATTKAIRRAVLAHCGLGMMDETEVETIPGETKIEIIQPVEWSEEDYKNAAQALLTALDTMYENGVPEDVINTAQEKAKQNIGDDTIDYEKWNNRLALMVERTINKYNPKV